MTLGEWIKQFEKQFSDRELKYMSVHKATIAAQLKDTETGNLHLHNLKYTAKDAPKLSLLRLPKPDLRTIQRKKGKTWKKNF